MAEYPPTPPVEVDPRAEADLATALTTVPVLAPSSSARNTIQPTDPTVTPLVVKMAAGQSADPLALQDFAGSRLLRVSSAGSIDANWKADPARPLIHVGNIAPDPNIASSIYFYGTNALGPGKLAWSMGIDTANTIPYRDFFLARANSDGTVTDFIYAIPDNGNGANRLGVGWVPPPSNYVLGISPEDADPTQGGVAIRVSTLLTTGKPLALIDSASAQPLWWVTKTGAITSAAPGDNIFQPSADNRVGLKITPFSAAQSADQFQVLSSAGTARVAVNPSGDVVMKATFDGNEKVRLQAADGSNNAWLKFTAAGANAAKIKWTGVGVVFNCGIFSGTNQWTMDDGANQVLVLNGTTSSPRMVTKAQPGLTANLHEWQDSTGAVLARHDAAGRLGLANSVAPATPTVGGLLYSIGGALHWKGSAGTDTLLAPA
jgi:hypothetical protein